MRDLGLIPGLGRSLGEEKGYPLQYSSLENSMDSIVHGVAKSWTHLRDLQKKKKIYIYINTHTQNTVEYILPHTHTAIQNTLLWQAWGAAEVSCRGEHNVGWLQLLPSGSTTTIHTKFMLPMGHSQQMTEHKVDLMQAHS